MYKKGLTTKVDPSHVYIAGFWSSGNLPFVIDSVFVSNSATFDTAVQNMTLKAIEADKDSVYLLTGNAADVSVRTVYGDGHKEDITTIATYTNPKTGVVQIANGQFIAKTDGEVTITVAFKDMYGNYGNQKHLH
jgi:hypothetical protein